MRNAIQLVSWVLARLLEHRGVLSLALAISCTSAYAQSTAPINPVLFIHGLTDRGASWETMIRNLDNSQDRYLIGGRLRSPRARDLSQSKDVSCSWINSFGKGDHDWIPVPAIPNHRRYFAIDFTDNHDLNLLQQARELKIVINCIKSIVNKDSPSSVKVDLVAHSMGGLAARAYIQGRAVSGSDLLAGKSQEFAYSGDIGRLITIGTPHDGATNRSGIVSGTPLCVLAGYSRCSMYAGVKLLIDRKKSDGQMKGEIGDLNRGARAGELSKPTPIAYHTIVAKGIGYVITTQLSDVVTAVEDNDGVVTVKSQSLLAELTNSIQIFHTAIEDKKDCTEWAAHSCEPSHLPIIFEVRRILGLDSASTLLSTILAPKITSARITIGASTILGAP